VGRRRKLSASGERPSGFIGYAIRKGAAYVWPVVEDRRPSGERTVVESRYARHLYRLRRTAWKLIRSMTENDP